MENNDNIWSDLANFLVKCKYKQLKEIGKCGNSEAIVFSLNIRSLHKNISAISENINEYQNFDVLCFNETNCDIAKLPNGIDDILLEGFHPPIVQAPTRDSRKGGGLATYVRNTFCHEDNYEKFVPKNMPEQSTASGEFLLTKIHKSKSQQRSIIIANVYRSPSKNSEIFFDNLESLLSKLNRDSEKQTLFVGDFNRDLINIDNDSRCQKLIDLMCDHGFVQTISRPTRVTAHSQTLIDHVYTNKIYSMISTSVVTVDISDHLATVAKISLAPNFDRTEFHPPRTMNEEDLPRYRHLNAENDAKFKELISNESWDEVLEEENADLKYDKFAEIYSKHYNAAYPEKKRPRRENERKNPKPWIIPWLESACARKNDMYAKFIKEPTIANDTKYKKMNKFVEKHKQLAKKKYYGKYFEQYKSDSRKQWSMLNLLLNRKKKSSSIKKLIDADGNTISSPTQMAETFNSYFVNIAHNLKQNNRSDTVGSDDHTAYLPQQTNDSIYLRPVESTEIKGYIKDLKNKATSDTKIGALKVAYEIPNFIEVLTDVVDSSFSQGIFPEQLKTAKVVPIHKDGKKTDVSNYRPISLLSTFSKLYEKAMYTRIYEFFESNNTLYEMQYGFRRGRSCEHALLTAQNTLLNSLNKKEIALLLLIDFSKAFDMVDHKILLNKLYHYGIRGIAHDWLKSYLSNRKQYVHINGKNSTIKTLEYGVPQGSILGPLLFVIYINDIPQIQQLAKFILYADDANIIITGQNMSEIEEKFNQLSQALFHWVRCNGLSLNIRKTNYMIFSRGSYDSTFQPKLNNIPIEQKTAARFLGVILDNKLNWNKHIQAIKTKMSRYLGIMYKLRGTLPVRARCTIFHSFVQSHLNYCSLVWGFAAKSHIDTLFRTQKKGIRTIMTGYVNYFYKDGETPANTKSTFSKHKILTVHNIIAKNTLIFMYKVNKFYSELPSSVRETISDTAPIAGSTYETCAEWLELYNNCVYRNSIFFKGPLIFSDFKDESCDLCFLIPHLKNKIKSNLFRVQSEGDPVEWQQSNNMLQNIQGLRKSERNKNSA